MISICKKAIKGTEIILHQAARGSIPKSTKDPILTNKDKMLFLTKGGMQWIVSIFLLVVRNKRGKISTSGK